ncbi:MAG: ABC transporter ATP-binding protein, partial [Bacteroidota bacterium]|nr:ABC transporter ATP-binding protein [Bacteroidota bacterium]
FASHNMAAVSQLCTKAILLNEGEIVAEGKSEDIVALYIGQQCELRAHRVYREQYPGDDNVRLLSCRFLQGDRVSEVFDINEESRVELKFVVLRPLKNLITGMNVYNAENICLFDTVDWRENELEPGVYTKELVFPGRLFAEGRMSILIHFTLYDPVRTCFYLPDVLAVEGIDSSHPKSVRGRYKGVWPGVLRPELQWTDHRRVPDGDGSG